MKTYQLMLLFLSATSSMSYGEDLSLKKATTQVKIEQHEDFIVGGGGGFVTKINMPERSSFDKVFKNNGFSTPSPNMIMFGGKGYTELSSGWRVGGSGYGGAISENKGREKASYSTAYGGFTIGKNISFDAFSLVPELLIGGGGASVTVFSETQNGRASMSGLALEPSIGFEYRLLDFLSIGVGASYLSIIEMEDKQFGDTLDVDLSVSDFNYTVQIVLGKLN